MSYATQQRAADLVQDAAAEGTIALYIESLPSGDFRLVFPAGDYAAYSQLLYAAADKVADHAGGFGGSHITLRD